MRKSELRQLIREEIRRARRLQEADHSSMGKALAKLLRGKKEVEVSTADLKKVGITPDDVKSVAGNEDFIKSTGFGIDPDGPNSYWVYKA